MPDRLAERLETERLILEPLRPDDADALAPVLDDPALHRFTGGAPLDVCGLRARFTGQARGHSPDGRDRWLNWTVRLRASGQPIGTVQATVTGSEAAPEAVLAWVLGSAFHGRGYAREAAGAMARCLQRHGVTRLSALIHPDHTASAAVARAIGLGPTTFVVDGERRWESPTGLDLYVAAFDARCSSRRRPSDEAIDVPGLRGLADRGAGSLTLLVTDDEGHDTLTTLLAPAREGVVCVLGHAPRSTAAIAATPGWVAKELTAMVCPDLVALPDLLLPPGLAVHPVELGDEARTGTVALEDAAEAVCRADPSVREPPAVLAAYLRGLRPPLVAFAALDDQGAVRATSGVRKVGGDASVLLVCTDRGWRGRGIGTAMTARALRHARDAGATQASLDASEAGRPIYERLGFTAVAAAVQFHRPVTPTVSGSRSRR